MKKLIIIGAARGADLVIQYFKNNCIPTFIEGMVDDSKTDSRLGIEVIGKLSYLDKIDPNKYSLCISSSSMKFRRDIYTKYKNIFTFENIQRSLPEDTCKIGNSNIIFTSVIIDWFSSIGNNNVISSGCIINHHNIIGDGNLFGPGCLFSGSVTIGNNCTFGSGIVIEPRVVIEDNVNIASGSVVTGDISRGCSIKAVIDMTHPNIFQGNRKTSKHL